jgi:hypothetical protein
MIKADGDPLAFFSRPIAGAGSERSPSPFGS